MIVYTQKKQNKGFGMETWFQVIAFIVTNLSAILWFRGESKEDFAKLSAKTDSLIYNFDKKFEEMQKMIYTEMRDFHGRLCAIEESRKYVEDVKKPTEQVKKTKKNETKSQM